MRLLRKLYDWTLHLSGHRHAVTSLAAVSFVESSLFPIPPDVLLLPMCLQRPERSFWYATVCTIASVLGGMLGYAIGALLFDTVGQAILEFYGAAESFDAFRQSYAEWGAWIVFGAGLTPFPYKVITIASGVAGLNPLVFIVASIVGRGIRFYAEALLLWKFGAPLKIFIEKYFGWLTLAFFVCLIGGFLLVKAFL